MHRDLPILLRAAACALPLLMASSTAFAQAGAACRPGGTVAETNACAVQDFQAADTAIAVLYADVMRALSAHERPQLRQEHTAWMRARNVQCKQSTRATEQQPEGPRIYHECLTRETQERRKGLMRWLSMDSPAKP
ncbi:lysozyme inhibitor LprI family protein [Acidovorax sp.]|uniref:lysozyme inhibitor LprI family protein n=1 Tax=Acidovorax sp. TaxID=1872122 RepID=UPI00391F044C